MAVAERSVMSATTSTTSENHGHDGDTFWRALFYRWFVEYNPLYLVSAALVLGGCLLWSRGLVEEQSLAGPLGVALVAEVYAASLIGGAALLVRIGLRRPAVMLALLSIIYQWDSTLHTETCAYLGRVGSWATAAWVLAFAAKLSALGWALRVRFAPRAVIAALLGAAGLALGPRVLPGLPVGERGSAVAIWVFALFALYRRGAITSLTPLDAWGRTVLRRATRAAWLLSGGLLATHVVMWANDHFFALLPACIALGLAQLRRIRGEGRAWATLFATLYFTAVVEPEGFSVIALIAAAALLLRAFGSTFTSATEVAPPGANAPYRASVNAVVEEAVRVISLGPAERARCVAGSFFAAYLATWTRGWSGGPFPAHLVALDLGLTLGVALWVWRTRARSPLLPLALTWVHLLVESRVVPLPSGTIAWGETVVTAGFALLAASLGASVVLRPRPLAPSWDR
jgi:hypothetical protein